MVVYLSFGISFFGLILFQVFSISYLSFRSFCSIEDDFFNDTDRLHRCFNKPFESHWYRAGCLGSRYSTNQHALPEGLKGQRVNQSGCGPIGLSKLVTVKCCCGISGEDDD